MPPTLRKRNCVVLLNARGMNTLLNEPTCSIAAHLESLCIIIPSDDSGSLSLRLASLTFVRPSYSHENEFIIQYHELSRFDLPKPCDESAVQDHISFIRQHLGSVRIQMKYRIVKEIHLDDSKKTRRSDASRIIRTSICGRLTEVDDIFETENCVGFIAYLDTPEFMRLHMPICPSSLVSITLYPVVSDRWSQMSILRQQQLKRGLIGRILPRYMNSDINNRGYIYLDIAEYDLKSKTTLKHSFLVTYMTPNPLVDASGNNFFHIILPSTHISFLPREREQNNRIAESSHYITKATQTLLDTAKSIRVFLSKGTVDENRSKVDRLGSIENQCTANIESMIIPRAFIFTGPPGGGKTYSVQMAVNMLKKETRLISIRGSEILASGLPSRSLIHTFQSALNYCHESKEKVAIVFMDECDALLSLDNLGHLLGAILDQMSSLVTMDLFGNEDHMSQAWAQIIIVAATNKIDTVPTYLRRPGRFDQEISIHAPDSYARSIILKSLLLPYRCSSIQKDTSPNRSNKVHHDLDGTKYYRQSTSDYNMGHLLAVHDDSNEVDDSRLEVSSPISAYDDTSGISRIAEACVGYVPADLTSLVRKAASLAAEEESEILSTIHLEKAMKDVGASALRAAATTTVPKTTWDDIVGDLGGAKTALIRAVEWPRTKKNAFASLGLVPPRGILLYGPPGCAKTSLARAAAGASGIAFFSLSPADVYSSSFVGDAEAVIRRTFAIARSASPCILFFDEIDAIIGCSSSSSGDNKSDLAGLRRGRSDGGSDAEVRVLSTFLNEMDGIDGSIEDGVLIFAATNRPHTLDAALLRPGRFDKVIYVPPPDEAGRRMILEAQCNKWQNSSAFDLDYLASNGVSANMTGAELVGACREAAMMAIRDALTSEGLTGDLEPRITNHHLERSIRNIKPLLADPQILIPYINFQSKV